MIARDLQEPKQELDGQLVDVAKADREKEVCEVLKLDLPLVSFRPGQASCRLSEVVENEIVGLRLITAAAGAGLLDRCNAAHVRGDGV